MNSMDNGMRYFRVRRTCLEMLADRGYLVSQEDVNADLEAFQERYGSDPNKDDLTVLAPKQDDPTEQIFVFFPDEAKVGVKSIKVYAERMRNENVTRALMVVQQALTPFAKQCLTEMAGKYTIEVFQDAEMLVNITKHVLVPKHQVLTQEEKRALLERYRVKDTQLPRIQFNDPVARYYGMTRGQVLLTVAEAGRDLDEFSCTVQVVRIVRPSETAGRYVTYRLCV